MPRDEIVQMDRELAAALPRARTVADRERLVIENLRRKEALVASERNNVIPLRR